jgi:hypothetical protein
MARRSIKEVPVMATKDISSNLRFLPTLNPDMKIVKEEIFGPVGVVIKFEDEAGMNKKKLGT